MQPPGGDPIRDYIRANLATHTQEAIRSQLIAAGHAPERVDAIWSEEWQGFALERSAGNLRALSLGLYVIGAILGGLGALMLAAFADSYGNGSLVPLFLIVYAVGYLGIGYALSRLVGWGVRHFRLGGWRTFLLGALLLPAYGGLMFGGCFAAAWLAQAVI
ncbi:MAG TPA: hypothetical protein VFJ00_02525 [Candidatus Limnocylindria bacterium]|nr:hypothetical protein [Candidatus Limnocylindria bacterium]